MYPSTRLLDGIAVVATLTLMTGGASAAVNGGGGLTLPGAAAKLGSAVAVAGDVNGDGYSDLIVGAPNFSNGQGGEGEALLFMGGPNGYSPTASWTFESDVAGANLGYAVAPAGDVNGDGYADVIVAAPNLSSNTLTNNGRAYVFLGGPSGLASTPAWTFDGTQAYQLFGWSVCTAGDVNDDGFDDVIIGSPGYQDITAPPGPARPQSAGGPAQTQTVFNNGRAYAFYGGPSGLAASPGWVKSGFQQGGAFGFSVSTANDVNGDGYSDVVISAPYGADIAITGNPHAGEIDVYNGSAAGLSTSASAAYYGYQPEGLRGYSVAGVGDIDGDGYADIAAGSPGYSDTANNQGAIFVYRGSASGLLNWDFRDEGPVFSPSFAGGQFGLSVAPAGDVNGDGYADFIAGAPFYTTNVPLGVNVRRRVRRDSSPQWRAQPKLRAHRLHDHWWQREPIGLLGVRCRRRER